MTPATFLENFEHLADAPNGVERLKDLVLQLAIQGKIVKQDPDDEPASLLLSKMEKERTRLIRDKKFKKTSVQLAVSSDEFFFPIPKSWIWTRLGEFGDWGAGATPNRKNPSYYGGEMPWFKSGELNNRYINQSREKITDLALKECSLRLDQPGDVLIAMYGATIGKIAILEVEATTNQAVCACTCLTGIFNRYLFILLKAYRTIFTGKGAGGAQPNISKYKIVRTPAPLPPLEEQKRIVAKVDQLMALCDELEEKQSRQRKRRINLNNSALDALLNAQDADECNEHWQRICDNFDLLYDHPETLGKLRSSILQLAISGKLVSNNPKNLSVDELKQEIQTSRKKGVKKAGRGKPVTRTLKDSELYDLHSNWNWKDIDEVTLVVTDGEHSTPPRVPTAGIPMATAKNVRDGFMDLTVTDYVNKETAEKCWKRCHPQHDDILMVCVGATTGRLTVIKNPDDFVLVRSVALVRPLADLILSEYLALSLRSPLGQKQIWDGVKQAAQPCLYINRIKGIMVPVPPYEEQVQIINKVDQLMTLCDELEHKLNKTQSKAEKYAEAVVAAMTAA